MLQLLSRCWYTVWSPFFMVIWVGFILVLGIEYSLEVLIHCLTSSYLLPEHKINEVVAASFSFYFTTGMGLYLFYPMFFCHPDDEPEQPSQLTPVRCIKNSLLLGLLWGTAIGIVGGTMNYLFHPIEYLPWLRFCIILGGSVITYLIISFLFALVLASDFAGRCHIKYKQGSFCIFSLFLAAIMFFINPQDKLNTYVPIPFEAALHLHEQYPNITEFSSSMRP